MGIIYIDDVNSEKLDWFVNKSETFLKTVNEPSMGYFVAESPNVIERALEGGYEPVQCLIEKKSLDSCSFLSREYFEEIPVYVVGDFSMIHGFEMTRGVMCIMKRQQCRDISSIINEAKSVAILEDVMNPTNLGAIFRSAAALGVGAVILTKGCADPLFKRASRVSMGTVFQIPWTVSGDIEADIDKLKESGYLVIALALSNDAVSIDDKRLKANDKVAMILGTEAFGISEKLLDKSDYTAMIPMYNGVDSLNVAAASAVAFYEIGKKSINMQKCLKCRK